MNHSDIDRASIPILRVLSIQSDILGHRTYCELMRHCFATWDDVDLSAFWYHDGRTFADRVIYKLAHSSIPLQRNNLDFRRARAEWSKGRMSRRLARRKLAERHFDVLHFHTQVQAFGTAGLMGVIPTVISCDMTAFQVARESTVRHPGTYKPNIAMESAVFHAAAHIVTWSQWARRSVIEEHGIAENKVTVISPGVRLDALADPIFAQHERLRILFVGGDFERKGGRELLEVFSRCLADRAELHLVTQHPVHSDLKNVFIHQNISAYSPQWQEQFRNADVFVMPSHAEAFGLVFQEAASFGLALIGTRIGAIPEMIIEGENGFTIKPGDQDALAEKLIEFIDDKSKLLRMRRQSRAIALEKFDAARNFRKLAELFRKVSGVSH